MAKLSEKQQRFVDYYIETGNSAEAARRAGYSEKTARTIGQENLTKPDIIRRIEERNRELASERIADMNEVREFWTATLRDNGQETKDRLKASEFIAKVNGAFIERREHTGIDGGPILTENTQTLDLSKLTDKELKQLEDLARKTSDTEAD